MLPGQLTIDDMLHLDAQPQERDGRQPERGGAVACWLSPEQAAARTPLSRKALYGAIRRGELRASKRCGRWMIRESDLDEWIAGGIPAESDPSPPARRTRDRRPAAGSLAALRAIEVAAGASSSDTFTTASIRRTT